MITVESPLKANYFVEAAVEASYYVKPRNPGLAREELVQIGALFGLKRGAVLDALEEADGIARPVGERARLRKRLSCTSIHVDAEGAPRNVRVYEAIAQFIRNHLEEHGKSATKIRREQIGRSGDDWHAIDVELAMMEVWLLVKLTDDVVTITETGISYFRDFERVGNRPKHPLPRQRFSDILEEVGKILGITGSNIPASIAPASSAPASSAPASNAPARIIPARISTGSAPHGESVYRWLHFSDLHVGCKDDSVWWQMLDDFERSLGPWLGRVGAPDLLLLTGDLAWSGAATEYERLDRFLARLLATIEAKTGRRPLLVPVPGNHDVQRPTGARLRPYRILDAYETGASDEDVKVLHDELWEEHNTEFVADLFTHYSHWLERTIVPQLTSEPGVALHRSFFPGDLTVTLDLPGRFPLAVVGLNTAWSHYKAGDFTGKLILPAEQFLAALPTPTAGGSPLDVFRQVERALLLMHHPRKWLTNRSREVFDGQIHLGHRFTACLVGHMHEPDAVNVSQAGGAARSFYQAPSLFGLEHYGSANESRIFGCTFGLVARGGEVRLWPLRSVRRGDGVWTFDRDSSFHWPDDDREGVLLRPADPRPPRASTRGPRPVPNLDLATYCREVLDRTQHIRLDVIATAAAKVPVCKIERLYTRLRTQAQAGDDLRRDLVDLGDLLPRHHRLLIEGQPGSGKTTFLRLVASVLARDFLDEPCPDGPSWRAVHLGRGVARTLPIFVKLSHLATMTSDTRKGAARLLDHLAGETRPRTGDTPEHARTRREAWDRRLVGGEATLLLDGLDEVGDPELREQVFAGLQDILRAWPKCQVLVTSRPIAVEPLRALGFAHASVAPFGSDEVRDYVERWVHACVVTDPDKAFGTIEETYTEKLIAALRSRQELRRLASAPVMLTCLCLVYLRGDLPGGRAEFYRDTIRWLIAAREQMRTDRGYAAVRVQEALSELALALMGNAEALKLREIGFADAAAIVEPMVHGPRFEVAGAAERSEALRAWLRFECEYGGVIEEVGGGRLQFKQLAFQEYLAAARLAVMEKREWWKRVKDRLQDLQWRETIDLFPGCLLDRERGAISAVDHLLEQVHNLWTSEPPLLRAARITALTGRFAPAFRHAKYQLPEVLVRRDAELRAMGVAIFTREGAAIVEEKNRIVVGEAIGVAGDGRIAAEGFEENLIKVEGMRACLGKYLVTVEEFARFVEDGGYVREELWVDEDGWSFRTRHGWEAPLWWDEQLRTPNRPVMGVSWYEATAYCRWLSGAYPTWRVRLPTEAEWMTVASPDGRRYPWGDEPPDAIRANFGMRVTAPTPVGTYPAGDGRYGHADLAGNVSEWSLDVDKDVRSNKEQLGERGHPRLLYGGNYESDAEGVAAAVRHWSWSGDRSVFLGFRIAGEAPGAATAVNPFLASRPLDGPNLPGRAHVLRELENLVVQRAAVLVKGPRRAGKTSVLRALAARLEECQVVHRISLEARPPRRPDDLARLIDPSLADDRRAAETLQRRLFTGIAHPPVILIDEIAWLKYSDEQLFPWLRMLSQEGLASLVLAGSHADWVEVIKAANRVPGSSFGNDFAVVELAPLAKDDAIRFLVDTAPSDVLLAPSRAVAWILECCGTWPFYLQVMGYAVVEEVRAGVSQPLVDRLALVRLYERRLLRERLAVFRSRWSDLRRPAQELLLAELERARATRGIELTPYADLSRPARTILSDADLIDAVSGWKIDRPFRDWLDLNLDELELSDA